MRSIWMVCAGVAILILGWLQWKWSKAFETNAMEVQKRQIHEGFLRLSQDIDEEFADLFLFFLSQSRNWEENDLESVQTWLIKWFDDGGSTLVEGVFLPKDNLQGNLVQVDNIQDLTFTQEKNPFEAIKKVNQDRGRRQLVHLIYLDRLWMVIANRSTMGHFMLALDHEYLVSFCRERIRSQVPNGSDLHWNLWLTTWDSQEHLLAKDGPILQYTDDQFRFGGIHPGPQPGIRRRMDRTMRRFPPQEPLFTLKVAHKTGSLRRSFAQIRHRQLMVSSGLLLLLGWIVWMLFRSYHSLKSILEHEKSFVAQVTHEVLTPVAALRSIGENMSDGLVKDQQKAKEYGSLLLQNTNRLNHLLEQILLYSKLSSQNLIKKEVRVADLMKDLRHLMFSAHPDVEIESHFDPNATILCEAEGVLRAIFNLCDNAVKHSGKPWVQIKFYSQLNPQKGMLIEICDKGEGFNEDQAILLTKPFARGTKAKNNQIPGSGLGLALVDTVAKAHGGFLKIQHGSPGCVLLFIAEGDN